MLICDESKKLSLLGPGPESSHGDTIHRILRLRKEGKGDEVFTYSYEYPRVSLGACQALDQVLRLSEPPGS